MKTLISLLIGLCLLCLALLGELSQADTSFKEAWPLLTGAQKKVTTDAAAFRIESFGTTQLSLKFKASSQNPQIQVEGPLPNNGDDTEPGKGLLIPISPANDGSGINLNVTLAEPGV